MKFYDLSVLVVEEDKERLNKIKESLHNIGFLGGVTRSLGNVRSYLETERYNFVISKNKPDFDLGNVTHIKTPEDSAASYVFFESRLLQALFDYKK